MSFLLFGICPCAIRWVHLIGEFIGVILIPRLPGLWNWLTQEKAFLLRFRGGRGACRAPVIVVSIKTKEVFRSLVLQPVIRVCMAMCVLSVLSRRDRSPLVMVLSEAHAWSLFRYYVQRIVWPRLAAPLSPVIMMMPMTSSVLFIKIVDPSASAFTHGWLSHRHIIVVSVVYNIIWELDLLGPWLGSGPAKNG